MSTTIFGHPIDDYEVEVIIDNLVARGEYDRMVQLSNQYTNYHSRNARSKYWQSLIGLGLSASAATKLLRYVTSTKQQEKTNEYANRQDMAASDNGKSFLNLHNHGHTSVQGSIYA